MRSEAADQRALVSWTKGQCSFTAAGLRHYEAACAQVHLVFTPQAIHTAKDFCRFLRALLQANCAPDVQADGSARGSTRAMQSLAQRALNEVALSSVAHHRVGLPFVAEATARPDHPKQRATRVQHADPARHDSQAHAAE